MLFFVRIFLIIYNKYFKYNYNNEVYCLEKEYNFLLEIIKMNSEIKKVYKIYTIYIILQNLEIILKK